MVAMDGDRGSGAALRRRENRLRAWQRHVRPAVRLALVEKLHHSANKVELHNARRGQEKRAGREEAGLETDSGFGHGRSCLGGCGRHLCLRCPSRSGVTALCAASRSVIGPRPTKLSTPLFFPTV